MRGVLQSTPTVLAVCAVFDTRRLYEEMINLGPWKTFHTSHTIFIVPYFPRPSSYLSSSLCSAELAVKPSSELNSKRCCSLISVPNILLLQWHEFRLPGRFGGTQLIVIGS